MSYVLGIDLGTTFSAAAVDIEGRSEIFQLGSRSAAIPSVVLLRSDGETLTGEAAERRAHSEPTRVAREFKRRLGDPTPMILGGTPYGAESVLTVLLRAIIEQVAQQRGEAPRLICITHPASYGPYKLDLLRQAVRQADIEGAVFLTEPEAAALHYASQERIETGSVIAVYDFGGGTFDATILRKTDEGFELLGQPEGMERLGGIDFDEAIFQHVARSLVGSVEQLDAASSSAQAGVARLREECRSAKEALSSDTEAVIAVLLPNVQTDVRITRSEFEAIIAPRIRETVGVLGRCVKSAGLSMEQVDRILLVGGTSRIPLVSATLREQTGRPVAVDAHPKHAVALGAATEARRRLNAAAAGEARGSNESQVGAVVPLASLPRPAPAPAPAVSVAAAAVAASPAAAPYKQEPPADALAAPLETRSVRTSAGGSEGGPRTPPRRPWWPYAAVAAGLVGAAVVAFLVFGGGDDDGHPAQADGPPTEATAAATTVKSVVSTETTPTPTATPIPPTPTPTLAPNTSRISAITVEGGRYQVPFEAAGFMPALPGQHVHFFFDTVSPQAAGVPGGGPWFVYGGGSPFTGYTVADRPSGANRMCILVARPNHSVIPDTGNCIALP